ncbi:putative elongation factor P--(R)-beta-lysine ligase [Pillotina sp. SPG140]
MQERACIIRRIRKFFDDRMYLEVDTPLLSSTLIPESCLEVFETTLLVPSKYTHSQPLWLIPSPEFWMKKLISTHTVNMYQLCHCFRNGESRGRIHNPEFSMLEYYTMEADYTDSLEITKELFAHLSLQKPFIQMTVAEAFERYAGFDLFDTVQKGTLAFQAQKLGLEFNPQWSVSALYDLIFVHAVEPRLSHDNPVVLMDYPTFVPCLAKKNSDGLTVQRWELYLDGVELANCYSEETDPHYVQQFFDHESLVKKQSALVPHAVDTEYWKIFKDFPHCSGVALGVDRLIMILLGSHSIDNVIPFSLIGY